MKRTAFLLAVAAIIAPPVMAADNSITIPAQPAQVQKPEDKVICKFINTTGSRLSRERECKTRAQWQRDSDETRDAMEKELQRAGGDPTPQ